MPAISAPLVLLIAATVTPLDAVTGDDDLSDAIAILSRSHSKSDLIGAADTIAEADSPEALRAVDRLVELCGNDNGEIRKKAVVTLGIVLTRNDRPCHSAIVVALGDSDPDVRANAMAVLDLFDDGVPPETAPFLLRAIRDRDADTRARAATLLGYCRNPSDTHRAVLFQALYDEDVMVRNNAIAALFVLQCPLEEILPHSLQMLETPVPEDLTDLEQSRHQLCAVAQAWRLQELGQEKPQELIPILIDLLQDDSELVRGAAARTMGAIWSKTPSARPVLTKHDARAKIDSLFEDESQLVRRNVVYALQLMQDE